MKIPNYTQQYLPTAKTNIPKSLAGEKRTAMQIPNTEAAIYNSLKQTGDKLFDIGTKIAKAEDVTEYNNAVVKLKEGYADIKFDLATNPAYNEYSVAEFEEKNTELSTQLQTDVMGKLTKYNAKKQTTIAAREMGVSSRVTAQTVGHAKFIDRERATTLKNLDKLKNSFIDSGDVKDLAYAEGIITSSISAGIFNKQEAVAISKKFKDNAISGFYENAITADPIGMYDEIVKDDNVPAQWEELSEEYQTNLLRKLNVAYDQKNNELKIGIFGSWLDMSLDKPEDTWERFQQIKAKQFHPSLNDEEYASLKARLKMNADRARGSGDRVDPVLLGRLKRLMENSKSQTENLGIENSSVKKLIDIVYSHDPRKAQAVDEQYQSEIRSKYAGYDTRHKIKNASIAENKVYLNSIVKPEELAPDFKTRQDAYDAALSEFNKKVDTLSTDPKKLFNEYFPTDYTPSADPATRIKEGWSNQRKLTDWYTHQGLPKSSWHMLTKGEASNYANNIADKQSNAIVREISVINKEYGENAKYVFKDLSREGLPTEIRLIAELAPNQMETVGVDLANASKLKDGDLTAQFGDDITGIKKDINSEIADNDMLNEFATSVFTTGTEDTNIKMVTDFRNATKKLAYIYRIKGYTSEQSVTKAAEALLGGKFNYIEQKATNKKIRLNQDQDKKLAVKAMNMTMTNLNDWHLSDRYFREGISGKQKEFDSAIMLKNLKTKGATYWKNGAGENKDKIILTDTVTDLPIYNNVERPITVDLNRLELETTRIMATRIKPPEYNNPVSILEANEKSIKKFLTTAKKTNVIDLKVNSPLSDEQLHILRTKDKRQQDKIKKWFKDNISFGPEAQKMKDSISKWLAK